MTSSDNGTELVKIDLATSGVDLEIFSRHFRMVKGQPKDFSTIISHFDIRPEELLVFGDRLDLDIEPALKQGCQAIQVPPYENLSDDFNWMSMVDLLT